MSIKICILNEADARSLTYGDIAQKCSSRRHQHYSKPKVDLLVKAGELVWVGKHRKAATFRNARTWMKVYRRSPLGPRSTAECSWYAVAAGTDGFYLLRLLPSLWVKRSY